MAGFCKHNNEPLGSIKENTFLQPEVSARRMKLHHGIGQYCIIREDAAPNRNMQSFFKFSEEHTQVSVHNNDFCVTNFYED